MRIEVTEELVRHIAHLARLKLDAGEMQAMRSHFLKILDYIRELQELDTEGIDPSLFSLDASNVVRPDEPGPSLPLEAVMGIAPQAEPPYFVVPQIVGDEAGAGSVEPGEGA